MPTEKRTIPDISNVSIFARRYIEAAILKNVFDEISNKFGVKASAWHCRRLSMAMVALLREPFGLPVLPAVNLPAVFLPFFIS